MTVEKATRDELAGLSEPVRTSATAEVALELARRLDLSRRIRLLSCWLASCVWRWLIFTSSRGR